MKSKEQIENERLVAEHNRHRRRLGYSFMRAPWSGTDYLYPLYLGHVITIEGDNRKSAAMNKVYEESTSPAEANEKIVKILKTNWDEE